LGNLLLIERGEHHVGHKTVDACQPGHFHQVRV